jgi:hypothetical protein
MGNVNAWIVWNFESQAKTQPGADATKTVSYQVYAEVEGVHKESRLGRKN